MQSSKPARGRLCGRRKAVFAVTIVATSYGTRTRGQAVAEATRQTKARAEAAQNYSTHVYTEDDLKRRVILTPKDQARAGRERRQDFAPAEQNAERIQLIAKKMVNGKARKRRIK